MSDTLRFVSDDLQLMALGFMAIVYILRIRWLLKFKASRERQAPSGTANHTSPSKGIVYSWANIAMPWARTANMAPGSGWAGSHGVQRVRGSPTRDVP